ncbi:hypothetical protein ACFL3E_02025 [Patescibacteria group bacterium]
MKKGSDPYDLLPLFVDVVEIHFETISAIAMRRSIARETSGTESRKKIPMNNAAASAATIQIWCIFLPFRHI